MFQDGFSDAGEAPLHDALTGEFSTFHLISASVAQDSALLRELAVTQQPDGALLYNHNDFSRNGLWMPEDAIDAMGLGYARGGAAHIDPLYHSWVARMLGQIEARMVQEEHSLRAAGLGAEEAHREALFQAADGVRGLQNFIARGLVVSKSDGDIWMRPRLVLRDDDLYVANLTSPAPQHLYAQDGPLDFDSVSASEAFLAGTAGGNVRDLAHFAAGSLRDDGDLATLLDRAATFPDLFVSEQDLAGLQDIIATDKVEEGGPEAAIPLLGAALWQVIRPLAVPFLSSLAVNIFGPSGENSALTNSQL